MLCSAVILLKTSISLGLIAFAFPPLGFLVKIEMFLLQFEWRSWPSLHILWRKISGSRLLAYSIIPFCVSRETFLCTLANPEFKTAV